MHVRKHRFEIPHWGKHSRSPANGDVLGSTDFQSSPFSADSETEGGPAPGTQGASSSRVSVLLPASLPPFPGLHLLKFQLLLGTVNFHSGLLWEKSQSRLLSFSLLSERRAKKFLIFFLFKKNVPQPNY